MAIDIVVSSLVGFLFGLASALILEKLNEYGKLLTMITMLSYEIDENQSRIDLLRSLDFEKCAQDGIVFVGPTHEMYDFVKDDLALLPPHVSINLTRYYALALSAEKEWSKFFNEEEYRHKILKGFLNTMENYSTIIMDAYFRPVLQPSFPQVKFYQIWKLLNTRKSQLVKWERHKQLVEEINNSKFGREDWNSVVKRYQLQDPK